VMPGRYIYTQRLKDANVNDQVSVFWHIFSLWNPSLYLIVLKTVDNVFGIVKSSE
jgi:hypothetical protein